MLIKVETWETNEETGTHSSYSKEIVSLKDMDVAINTYKYHGYDMFDKTKYGDYDAVLYKPKKDPIWAWIALTKISNGD